MEITIQTLFLIISITASLIFFIIQTWIKARIETNFKIELENVKNNYQKETEALKNDFQLELEKIRADYAKNLEMIKAEIKIFDRKISVETEAEKATLLHAVAVRAEKFPILVACLRGMKNIIERLHISTNESALGYKPINLNIQNDDSNKVKNSFNRLKELADLFDNVLSEVRLFTDRSDFDLPPVVRAYVNKWLNGDKDNLFYISNDEMRTFNILYSDDISYLTNDFYRHARQFHESGDAGSLLSSIFLKDLDNH